MIEVNLWGRGVKKLIYNTKNTKLTLWTYNWKQCKIFYDWLPTTIHNLISRIAYPNLGTRIKFYSA